MKIVSADLRSKALSLDFQTKKTNVAFIISLCCYFFFREDADNSEKSGAGQGSAGATPATTPEEEENSIDNEAFVPSSKPRTKVKPKVEEATTTEKEHVNVVFIGHVGK